MLACPYAQSCLFHTQVWAADDFSSCFFSLRHLAKTWSQIRLGDEYFSYWWFRLNLRKQRAVYEFNLWKGCGLDVQGSNTSTVMLNSSCLCLSEWGSKKENLLTLFLADTKVFALWVCFYLFMYSHFWFWLLLLQKRSDAPDPNRVSYHRCNTKKRDDCYWFYHRIQAAALWHLAKKKDPKLCSLLPQKMHIYIVVLSYEVFIK